MSERPAKETDSRPWPSAETGPAELFDDFEDFETGEGWIVIPAGEAALDDSPEPGPRAPSGAAEADSWPGAAPGAAFAERYAALERIGSGACGEIWSAWQRSLGRPVAIKKIKEASEDRPEQAAASRLAFAQEAVAAVRLEHPNIAPVHELCFAEDGSPRIVMKLLEGEPWEEAARRDFERMAPFEFLDKHLPVLIDVAQAAGFAHSRGIVHRDIKPAQVVVGEFGQVTLTDWGLAITMDGEAPRPPSDADLPGVELPSRATARGLAGTPAMMAPEQAEPSAEGVGPWTDVFLLGGTLYFLLTGAYPHEGGALEALRRAARCEIAPPEERAPGRAIPAELSALCLQALERDPAKRVPSAKAFAERLQDYFSGAFRRREAREIVRKARESFLGSTHSYGQFFHLVGELERARGLWPDNPELPPLLEEVRLYCARAALTQDDLAMASLQASRMERERDKQFILSEVKTKKERLRALAEEAEERDRAAIAHASATQALASSILGSLAARLDPSCGRDAGLIDEVAELLVAHSLNLDLAGNSREWKLRHAEDSLVMAIRLSGLGRHADASELAGHALDMRVELLGEVHMDVAACLDAQAGLLRLQGLDARAEPLEERAELIRRALSAKETGNRMTKILLVEDNEMNRDLILRRLGRRGYEIVVAEDGQQALDKTKAEKPDLILMDMSLPVMDGWQATRILKADESTRPIPIIGLSAHAMRQDYEKAMQAGCDDYDTKPVDLKRLLEKIENSLSMKKS